MLNDFLPSTDGNLDTWEHNFLTVFLTVAESLGFTPQEIADIVAAITGHRQAYATAVTKQAESKAAVKAARMKRDAIIKLLRLLAKRISASPNCTEELRLKLKIKGSNKTVDLDSLEPELSQQVVNGKVQIKFNKPFPVEGIRVWSKRGDETEFMFLNSVSHSPFKDPRPRLDPALPEVRQYRFMFLVKDEEVGQLSHIVEVLV